VSLNSLFLGLESTFTTLFTLSDTLSDSGQFHECRSVASITQTVAPPGGVGRQPLLRQLSEPPLSRVHTCPASVHHVTDMEGTVTFVVPELCEKTLMNVSLSSYSYIAHITQYGNSSASAAVFLIPTTTDNTHLTCSIFGKYQ